MKSYPGYKLMREEFVDDIKSQVYHFEHEKLKTPVVAIKNDDSNKTFCISYRTIPNNSSGAAHILEHTVLSGSRKYPLKEVFNELTKGGLATFLNAMTGPDTTFYPFATRNLQEYFNLMDVYLDTTLFPNLDKHAFMQEGWRHELEDANKEIELKGVVYNEMKGVYSNPLSQAWYNLFKQLMPESTYAHVSGGNPENIPELSWQGLREFHHQFYHPSNSLITFYGDAPLEKELAYLDDHFFSSFDYKSPESQIDFGVSNSEFKSVESTYSVNEDDDISEKTFIALGIPVSTADKVMENLALKILGELLHSSEASPLKIAFHQAKLGKDIEGGLINHIHTTFMLTEIIGSEKEKRDEFLSLYNDVLTQIVKDGFDKELVLSELNGYEFHKQEEQYNSQRGLTFAQSVISANKLNIDMFDSLRFSEQFEKLRNKILNENYLEHLIEKNILGQDNGVCLVLSPMPGKSELEKKELTEKLAHKKSTMDDNQIQTLVDETAAFKKFHQKENTDDELNSLPRLSRKDLPSEPEIFHSEKTTLCGSVPYYRSEIFTGRIVNVSIGFNTSCLPVELLPYLELFGNIITEIGTSDMDYIQFCIKKDQILGGLNHKINTYHRFKNRDNFQPIFWLNLKMLDNYIPDAIELVEKIILDVSFDNVKRIQEILERNFAWLENYIQSEGYNLPVQRLQSYIHESGWYMEQVSGLTAYQNIKLLQKNFTSEKNNLIKKLKTIKEILFNRKQMIVSITGSGEGLKLAESRCSESIEKMPNIEFPVQKITLQDSTRNEAFMTSSEIVFAVQGGDMLKAGITHNGSFEVLKTWLSRSFLHKRVRAQGGAYGCFAVVDPLLGFNCYVSYRDPNIKSTYDAYEEIPQVVSSLELNHRELEQLIIRTYGNFDPLLNPFAKALRGRNQALSSIPESYLTQFGNEIRHTTVDQMKAHADLFDKFFKSSFKTVIGNKEKITSSSHFFDAVIEV